MDGISILFLFKLIQKVYHCEGPVLYVVKGFQLTSV